MKKQEYLDKLELELRSQNITKVQEILADYHEHFAVGLGKGKSEEEIVDKLGDAPTIAKAYQAEDLIRQIEDAPVQDQFSYFIRAILRLIILTPLNFFMLVGPVLILSIILFTMWTLVVSIGVAGVAFSIKVLMALPIMSIGLWGMSMSLFGMVSTISGALLGVLIMFFITKFLLQMFISYLRWNIEFIKGDAK